jgi:hypothetical protein
MARISVSQWVVSILAALGVIALLAWARNDPGVGGRFPDPEDVVVVVIERS